MRKKILIGSLVLVVVIVIILQANYAYQMKLASLIVENKIEKAVEKIKETAQPTPTPSPTPAKSVKATLNDALNKSQSSPIENSSKFNTAEKSIARKYAPKFAAIKGGFVSAIDGMINQANAEYLSYPAAERDQHKLELGFKYMAKGEALEKSCDVNFYAQLARLKTDLKKNNLGPGLADTAKLEYEQQKRTVKKALTDKLLG